MNRQSLIAQHGLFVTGCFSARNQACNSGSATKLAGGAAKEGEAITRPMQTRASRLSTTTTLMRSEGPHDAAGDRQDRSNSPKTSVSQLRCRIWHTARRLLDPFDQGLSVRHRVECPWQEAPLSPLTHWPL